jgi:putative aldouronate transport system permease protein
MRNRIRRSLGEHTFDAVNALLMLVVALVMIYPLWYVIVYALNSSQDSASGHLWFWPRKFTVENIVFVLRKPILQRSYIVTIARTVIGPLLNLVVTGFAAFSLSKRYLPGRKFLTYYLILPIFIGSPIVATYVVYARMHLLNNFLVYILPGAFTFFMMAVARAFIEELPASLEESAKMDGAGYLRIFFQLVVPLSTPIIATMLIFSAVGNWLDFYTNLLFISSDKLYTLQYLLYVIVQQQGATAGVMGPMQQQAQGNTAQFQLSSETVNMTTLVIVTLPILFVYPFFQKYIIKGILIGAIKE